MKENSQGKEILKLIQENYDIKSKQDLLNTLKDMFKGELKTLKIKLFHLMVEN
jgi:hypothetical protein